MATIRTFNDIVSGLIDWYNKAQPRLDTKPGSVSRDLLIDGPAAQTARIYDELNRIANLQSLRLATGSDLDKLAQNFGATRLRGSKSTGPALLTFNSVDADISITKGDLITAKNGSTFVVTNSLVISTVLASNYQSLASRYRADLDYVGINDQYAVEILLEASASGSHGNISKYSLSSANISGINNVLNVVSFGGGKPAESDAAFRTRVLAIFSGANTGTSLGYRNAVLADSSVIDALVIEPGDSLMTRDGTQVSIASDGTRTILSEGTGGKVDVLVFGSRLQESADSFVYRDKSNTDDPTHDDNDYVLGQITGDENKTVTKKRLDNLETGILPNQPVNNLVSVSGSISGPNFVEKSVDDLGRVTGNYELIRDDGAYAGSPWGFDRLHWISDRIENFSEDKTKSTFNNQDALSYPDVLEIKKIQQNIVITNENSRVSAANRSSIQLAHSPVTAVTRVFNVTTGERYVVSSQNPDGSGSVNTTGRIVISGKSLPAVSDILQVDYTWIYSYDSYFDFDNKVFYNNVREVSDSVDWGLSNAVRRERVVLTESGSFLLATVTHPISAVSSVNVYTEESSTVSLSSNTLAVVVVNSVENVVSIIRDSDGAELWSTFAEDGSFSGLTIFLPSDTVADLNDSVTVVYNSIDVFNADVTGSFNDATINIVASDDVSAGSIVECNYIANINTILSSTLLSKLPAIRSGNTFETSNATSVGCQPTTHLFLEDSIVQNLRLAPSNLALNIAGNISPGVITVAGTTLEAVIDVVFTATVNGLTQEVSAALKSHLGLSSKTSIPSNVKIVKLAKLEKVSTTTSLEVLEVLHTYDIKGYKLSDNYLSKNECIQDTSLSTTQIQLPATEGNEEEAPVIGDRLRIRCYIAVSENTENVYFTKSGTQYTDNKFIFVDVISISSGFTSAISSAAILTITNLNQPLSKSRYKVYYDYLGPKTNERITVTFNYDKLISDATLAVENTRPINADVLVKAATPILVDVTINIVVTEEFINSSTIVQQNVQDAVSSALQARALGTTIDSSDLIQIAYTVSGVDRARIIFFNKTESAGSVLSIEAQKNQYIYPNNVVIDIETR